MPPAPTAAGARAGRRQPLIDAAAVAQPAQPSAHDRLFQLFKDSDEANLKRNPLNAIFRGDLRYADRLGDCITDEYYAAERAAAEADLAALQAIPRDQLNATDQLAYDVFEFSTKDTLRGYQPDMLGADRGAADEPLLRLPHFLPDLRQRQGRGAVQDARGL